MEQATRQFWRNELAKDLAKLRHAEAMYARQKTDASREVIWEAMYSLRKDIQIAIHQMGGIAGEW